MKTQSFDKISLHERHALHSRLTSDDSNRNISVQKLGVQGHRIQLSHLKVTVKFDIVQVIRF